METETETPLATRTPDVATSPMARLASKHGVSYEALKRVMLQTVIKCEASDEEILAFLVVCDRYGLDPIRKQVYAMQAKGGGLVPIVGVDGWASLIAADARCDGFTFRENHGEDGKLVSMTCVMRVKGRTLDTEVTEYLSECRRNTEPWKMEHRMLRHKTLMQAGRVVYGFCGIYDDDEGRDVADGRVNNGPTEREQQAAHLAQTIETAKAAKAERDTQATEGERSGVKDDPATPSVAEAEVVKEWVSIVPRDTEVDKAKKVLAVFTEEQKYICTDKAHWKVLQSPGAIEVVLDSTLITEARKAQ